MGWDYKYKTDLLKKLKTLKLDYTHPSDFSFEEENIELEEYINAPICHIYVVIFNR